MNKVRGVKMRSHQRHIIGAMHRNAPGLCRQSADQRQVKASPADDQKITIIILIYIGVAPFNSLRPFTSEVEKQKQEQVTR